MLDRNVMPSWKSLSLKEQIAQMIVVRASGYLFDHQIRYPIWEADNSRLHRCIKELNIGGVILLGGSSIELQKRTQILQSWAKIPLFIAADIEEGIGQRFPGGTWFPPPMALGKIYDNHPQLALQYAIEMGKVTATEAIAVGINWILAPVVDVNNNPANPVINIRAFSESTEVVSVLSTAFLNGARSYPVLTTAKHFPGHGDTATDSHLELPSLPHDDARLAQIELPPFQAAIAAGVDSVMTAHLSIPVWDDRPATLSNKIITGKLRQQLGFSGLVVTDALIMGGITKYASPEEAAILAVEAGNDILLMPDDPEVAITSIYEAVQSGRIGKERIEQSLERIWQAKAKISNVNITPALSSSEARLTVHSIVRDSLVTANVPLAATARDDSRNLIVVDDVLNASYLDLNAPAIAIPQQLGYQRQIVDSTTINCILSDDRFTLLQVFIRGNPFRGNAGLTDRSKHIYQQLIDRERVEAIVIYGSPYVLDWFRSFVNSKLPCVFTYGQMKQAQAIALATLYNFDSKVCQSNYELNFGF